MILDNWAGMRTRFVKVFPLEYKRALKQLHEAQQRAEPQRLAAE
jgi:glutamate synthase domain-containing protein 3